MLVKLCQKVTGGLYFFWDMMYIWLAVLGLSGWKCRSPLNDYSHGYTASRVYKHTCLYSHWSKKHKWIQLTCKKIWMAHAWSWLRKWIRRLDMNVTDGSGGIKQCCATCLTTTSNVIVLLQIVQRWTKASFFEEWYLYVLCLANACE